MKFEAQDFASDVSNKHAFKIWRKKRGEFFDDSSTLSNSLFYLDTRELGEFDTVMQTRNYVLGLDNFRILSQHTFAYSRSPPIPQA